MDFTDLEVYQLAERLTLEIYKITAYFPKEEIFGLISQLKRAVASIGANIAESFGRFHYDVLCGLRARSFRPFLRENFILSKLLWGACHFRAFIPELRIRGFLAANIKTESIFYLMLEDRC